MRFQDDKFFHLGAKYCYENLKNNFSDMNYCNSVYETFISLRNFSMNVTQQWKHLFKLVDMRTMRVSYISQNSLGSRFGEPFPIKNKSTKNGSSVYHRTCC